MPEGREGQARTPGRTFKSAALRGLQDAGEPLHYRAIAERAAARGLLTGSGRTPEQPMAAQLRADVSGRGDASPFVPVRRWVFGLRGRDRPLPAPVTARLRANGRGRLTWMEVARPSKGPLGQGRMDAADTGWVYPQPGAAALGRHLSVAEPG
jgi:hypothetical protein